MPKDQFERPLKKGDLILIDAIVEEVFDEGDEDHPSKDHVRVKLTNGPLQTIVMHAAAVAKVENEEVEQPASGADASGDDSQKNSDAQQSEADPKNKPRSRSAK